MNPPAPGTSSSRHLPRRSTALALAAALALALVLTTLGERPAGAASTGSAADAAAVAAAKRAPAALRIGTYNIQKHSSSRPWKKRRAGVAALVRSASPDVLGIQEANGPHKGSLLRFPAGDLRRLLPGYATVRTRAHRGTRELSTTGRYIFYKAARVSAQRNGELGLGSRAWAVWSELTDRATGQRFMVVNAHLVNGNTAARDRVRRGQTQRLVGAVGRVNVSRLPVVYVGDFNSHADHRSDAPTKVLAASGWVNSYRVSASRSNGAFNSNNRLWRKPPRKGLHADYVYVPRGSTVSAWTQGLRLKGKRFRGVIPSDHNPIFATVRLG